MAWIAWITGACLLFYVLFTLRAAWYFSREKKPIPPPSPTWPSVSVIIPARNEAHQLATCLATVLKQSYPGTWEVWLVNDHSTDDTLARAQEMARQSPQLHVWDLQVTGQTQAFKKAALKAGIEQAKGEIIVQTDADCEVGEAWLKTLVSPFLQGVDFVSGPVALTYAPKPIEALQALEVMGLGILGAGSLLAGTPNMCNGANMAYRKNLFFELGGLQDAQHVASGDDEFLLQKFHRAGKKLAFAKDERAIVHTSALTDWSSLKAQRLRWVSKARNYLDRRVNIVQLLSYIGFWFFPAMLV